MNRRLVLVAAAIVCGWIWTAWSQTTPPKKDKAPEVNLPPPAQFSRYAAEGRVGRPPRIVKQGGGAKDSRKGDDDDADNEDGGGGGGVNFTTYAIRDLKEQIRRLGLLNMWKPSPAQLKKMWEVLTEAEADRQMFLAKMEKMAPEIEASWVALRQEAMKGVVDSFDQDPQVEKKRRACRAALG